MACHFKFAAFNYSKSQTVGQGQPWNSRAAPLQLKIKTPSFVSIICDVFQDAEEDESEANVESEEGHTTNTSQDPDDLCCSSRDAYKKDQ